MPKTKNINNIQKVAFLYYEHKEKADRKGVPSIKQVLPTIKNKFVGATTGRPRAFNERPYITKGQRFFVSALFHTPCPARYSVLHLLGVLSGTKIAFLWEEGGTRSVTEGARATLDLY